MKNHRLPFLDTEIRLINNKYELFHYQKPSKSDCLGHFTKNIAPRSHKISLLTGELNRINNSCTSEEALTEGLEKAKIKFLKNGYPSNLIDEKIRYLKSINFTKEPSDKETDIIHYFKAVYTGERCDSVGSKIRNIIKSVTPKFHVTLAWKTVRLESCIFPKLKRDIPLRKRGSCVYEFKCFCGTRYQGETNRTLEIRFREHFDTPAAELPIRAHIYGCSEFMEKYNLFKSDPSTLRKFKRKNTAEATFLTEFAFISKLISIVEANLENYHDRKTGEAFTIKLSDPILNRQIHSKSVNFL